MTEPTTPANLRAWFDALLDQPENAREAWLDTRVPVALRAELRRLLARDARPELAWLDEARIAIAQAHESTEAMQAGAWTGREVGGWRLLACIGEGGMSAVYRAERADGSPAPAAAVKLLLSAAHGERRRHWFHREQAALAALEHPNITRLLGGGIEHGLPYLAMELVEGRTLLDHLGERRLGLRPRLELFIAICGAVAYAHQRLIVHRDLKPQNIMVTTGGTVKLLDFGIAKLLDADEVDTNLSSRVLTPEYAAPEQFTGEGISTATDVYALGLVLHEMLVGRRPDPRQSGLPSRSPPPEDAKHPFAGWRHAITGDLDNIILRALAVDPQLRYPNAQALGEDVERHLAGFPVLAHPPSRIYRARKFLRRHRGAASVTVALLMAVLVSLGAALVQADHANRQAELARAQAQRATFTQQFLVDTLATAASDLPRGERPGADALARAAAQRLRRDLGIPGELRAALHQVLARVSLATGAYAQALDFSTEAGRSPGIADSAEWIALHAEALVSVDRVGEAHAFLQARRDRMETERSLPIADAWLQLAQLELRIHRDQELAIAFTRRYADLYIELLGADDRRALGAALQVGVLRSMLGQHAQARSTLEPLLARWRVLGHPESADLAIALNALGKTLSSLGERDRALAALEESLRVRRAIHDAPHDDIATSLAVIAAHHQTFENHGRSLAYRRESLRMREKLFPDAHPKMLLSLFGLLTSLSAAEADPAESARLIDRVHRACDGLAQPDSNCTLVVLARIKLALQGDDVAGADALLADAMRESEGLPKGDPRRAMFDRTLGQVRLRQKRHTEALAAFDAAARGKDVGASIAAAIDVERAEAVLGLGDAGRAMRILDDRLGTFEGSALAGLGAHQQALVLRAELAAAGGDATRLGALRAILTNLDPAPLNSRWRARRAGILDD
jgi:tetratricopeptide (TPR) repeat protein